MKTRDLLVLTSLLMVCALAAPAVAGIAPYVRLDYGGNGLRMTDQNISIRETEAALVEAGYPAAFQTVGLGYGPTASVGLWILPGFRVGATYSYLRAVRNLVLHVPDEIFYADDLDFRMTEIGAEAAVRFSRLQGLTVGVNVAQGRGELIEGYALEDAFGAFYMDVTAHRTRMTGGAFVGIDQTNLAGVAGFIRAGFQYRDMGRMPGEATLSDGTTTVQTTGRTTWLDYSGFYVRVGVGYDLVR